MFTFPVWIKFYDPVSKTIYIFPSRQNYLNFCENIVVICRNIVIFTYAERLESLSIDAYVKNQKLILTRWRERFCLMACLLCQYICIGLIVQSLQRYTECLAMVSYTYELIHLIANQNPRKKSMFVLHHDAAPILINSSKLTLTLIVNEIVGRSNCGDRHNHLNGSRVMAKNVVQ